MKKIFFILSIFSLIIVSSISCNNSSKGKDGTRILKLSHPQADGYPLDIADKKFAEIVSNKSMGKYIIEIYPSSQLGDSKASLELAKSDVIQFAHINAAVLESFDSMFLALNLPYIFKDYTHYTNVMRSEEITKYFESTLDEGFISLMALESGSRNIYTKSKPINTTEDLHGLKIRVQDSPTSIEMIKLLGGSPVVINYSEVYTSLQQGVIDGAENNFPSFVETGHAEVAKYYSLTEHMRISDILTVGAPFWNSLSEEDKQMFRDAAIETEKFFSDIWKKSEEANMEKAVKEYGVTIVKPDTTLFRNAVLKMHEDLYVKNPELKDILDFIKSMEK